MYFSSATNIWTPNSNWNHEATKFIDLTEQDWSGYSLRRPNYSLPYSSGTLADGASVIPISAQLKYNIDVVAEYLVNKIPIPLRDLSSAPRSHHPFLRCDQTWLQRRRP